MNFSILKKLLLVCALVVVSACKIKPPETREQYTKYLMIMGGGDEKAYRFTKKMLEDGTDPKIHFEQQFKASPITGMAIVRYNYDPFSLKPERAFNEWDKKVIKLLLDAGANINHESKIDIDYFTPFMAAIWANNVDVARFLLEHGADPHHVIYPRNDEPINAMAHLGIGCADKTIPLMEELGFSFELDDWFTCNALASVGHQVDILACKKVILDHFGTYDTSRCPRTLPTRP